MTSRKINNKSGIVLEVDIIEKLIFIKKIEYMDRIISVYYYIDTKAVYITDSLYGGYRKLNIIVEHNKYFKWQYSFKIGDNKKKSITISETDIKMNILEFSDNITYMYVWNTNKISDYLDKLYTKKGLDLPSYNMLSHFNNKTPEKSIYRFFCGRGGVSEYYNLYNFKNGSMSHLVYRDSIGNIFRSFNEFVFSCICHCNSIKYEYEPFKIKNRIPDFYLPDLDIIFEIVGYKNDSEKGKLYHISLGKKKIIYDDNNYKAVYIIIDKKNPIQNIIDTLIIYYPNIIKPDITEYYKNYCLNNTSIIKKLLTQYNNREIDCYFLVQNYINDYNFIILLYGTLENAIKKELNIIPNRKNKKDLGIDNCFYWLNIEKNIYGNLPTYELSKKDSNLKYTLFKIYKKYGTKEFKKGGLFYGYVGGYMI